MTKLRKAFVAAGVAVAVLVPASAATASLWAPGDGPDPDPVCTGDHDMDRVRARDGSGWRHSVPEGTTVQAQAGAGHQHRGGVENGTGPRADRPMDGAGWQRRAGMNR